MKVLSAKYPGLWFICEQCGSVVIDVQDNEIYNGRDVYCPICKFKMRFYLIKIMTEW